MPLPEGAGTTVGATLCNPACAWFAALVPMATAPLNAGWTFAAMLLNAGWTLAAADCKAGCMLAAADWRAGVAAFVAWVVRLAAVLSAEVAAALAWSRKATGGVRTCLTQEGEEAYTWWMR